MDYNENHYALGKCKCEYAKDSKNIFPLRYTSSSYMFELYQLLRSTKSVNIKSMSLCLRFFLSKILTVDFFLSLRFGSFSFFFSCNRAQNAHYTLFFKIIIKKQTNHKTSRSSITDLAQVRKYKANLKHKFHKICARVIDAHIFFGVLDFYRSHSIIITFFSVCSFGALVSCVWLNNKIPKPTFYWVRR